MARIILGQEVFEPLSPAAQYERDYERLILGHAGLLFPGFVAVEFKQPITSVYGTAIPDIALIDREYRAWWVVEVELASHDLDRHVEPQVQVLSTGEYGELHARALGATAGHISLNRCIEMVRWVPPKVLVVVNAPARTWSERLRQYDVKVAIVEVFRSGRNRDVLQLNGDPPESLGTALTTGEIDPCLPSSLRVHSPAALPVQNGERLTLWFEGGTTDWQRVDTGGQVWLMPSGRCPIPPRARAFLIKRDGEGALTLRITR